MFFVVILIATIINLFIPANLCAQTVGTQSNHVQHVPFTTVNVRLVVLDVVVTDKSGRPVNGLTAKDFQVFEDDKQQTVNSFEPPSTHTLPPATITEGTTAVFNPAQPSAFGNSPVNILVLDQSNTHYADSSFARRSLHDYLAKEPALLPQPTTLLSIYDNHFEQLQAFTRDRDSLLRALDDAPNKYPWKLELNGKTEFGPVERLDQSLRALEEIAQNYARISGRKNLIWIGGGFPTINPTTIDGDDALVVKQALQHVTNVLLNTRVTLYAVDPTSSAAGMTEITDTSQMEFVEDAGDAVAGGIDPFGASDDFNNLGPVTGGRVLRGRNDITQQIASSVNLGNHFYTLAYTPSSTSDDASMYRNIRVVCLRPGLTATTRSGYYPGESSQENSSAAAEYDLTTAAESVVPLNGLRVSVDLDSSSSDPQSTYIVHVAAANLTWMPKPDGGATASVYIMAVSLNAKNKILGHTLHGMTATAKAGAKLDNAKEIADFSFTSQPLPKATTYRFVVRDNSSGRMGSVDLKLKNH